MSINQYRVLLMASLILAILGGTLDHIFPALLPDEFHEAQDALDYFYLISAPYLLLFIPLGIFGMGCALFSAYGLYRFRPWAPRLAVAGTVLALISSAFMGAFAQSGYTAAISSVASCLWGAVIFLAYVQPISDQFERNVSPDYSVAARKLYIAGYILIVISFALPFLVIPFGFSNIFHLGGTLVYSLVALFLLALIAWLITRKRSDDKRAIAVLLCGILMCLFSASKLLTPVTQEQDTKQQVLKMLFLAAKTSSSLDKLESRLENFLGAVSASFDYPALATPSGLATAKASVAHYNALLSERRLLMKTYHAELEQYMNALPPGKFKDTATLAFGIKASITIHNDLDRMRTALVESISNLHDWFSAQSGKLLLQDNRLIPTPNQAAELRALFDEREGEWHKWQAACNELLQLSKAAKEKSVPHRRELVKLLLQGQM